MKRQDIKVGNIYLVDFGKKEKGEVRKGEFDKEHLAVVMKKNYNKITFIVVPMTKTLTDKGINKIDLGKLDCLPANLRDNNTYAVIDQVRTVSCERFRPLLDNGEIVQVQMPKDKLLLLYKAVIKDFLHDVSKDDITKILNIYTDT